MFLKNIKIETLHATPSLTPRLSFFPLWMLFAANAGVGRGDLNFYIEGEPAAPLPGGRGTNL